jgi:hypothetical protein
MLQNLKRRLRLRQSHSHIRRAALEGPVQEVVGEVAFVWAHFQLVSKPENTLEDQILCFGVVGALDGVQVMLKGTCQLRERERWMSSLQESCMPRRIAPGTPIGNCATPSRRRRNVSLQRRAAGGSPASSLHCQGRSPRAGEAPPSPRIPGSGLSYHGRQCVGRRHHVVFARCRPRLVGVESGRAGVDHR